MAEEQSSAITKRNCGWESRLTKEAPVSNSTGRVKARKEERDQPTSMCQRDSGTVNCWVEKYYGRSRTGEALGSGLDMAKLHGS